jgi:PAS domain S-box-containing protein
MMTGTENQIAWLSDPRLAAHALSPSPAWLWSADAKRLLWANPTAAAIFKASSPGTVTNLRFEPGDPSATQIARLAGTLPHGGAPRLERLRGFGASLGGALVCLCSRITLNDNSIAILVVSTERAGMDLALPERARRVLSDLAGAALFTADGEWVDGTGPARERLGSHRDLVTLGAEMLAREATMNGRSEGEVAGGHALMLRLGAGATFQLLLAFTEEATPVPSMAPAAEAAPLVPATDDNGDTPALVQKLPFRFIWQMDAAGHFTHGVEHLARLAGPKTAAMLKRPWTEIANALELDPEGQIARALASHETWSGIVVDWPTDAGDVRLPIEMSGLPVFDRDRRFAGFRGFGIFRGKEPRTVAEAPPPSSSPPSPEPQAKVLPFPASQSPAVAPPTEHNDTPAAPTPLLTGTAPTLSPGEHNAFQELARELTERLKQPAAPSGTAGGDLPPSESVVTPAPNPLPPPHAARKGNAARDALESRPILDRLPVGILVYRLNNLLYANRAFLAWTGYPDLAALNDAGGLDSLFIETADGAADNGAKALTITTVNGDQKPVDGRLFSVSWNEENALVLMINTQGTADTQTRATDATLRRTENENRELKAILDTATDGVLVLDRAGRVLSANRSAQALFGYEAADITELTLGDLFAPESRRPVLDHLDRLARGSGAGMLDPGREGIGLVRQGGLVPLYITMGRIEGGEKLCAVLRDLTAWKRNEEELINARHAAEKTSIAKSEFLAKISHEIRTPLNAIIGFSEVMMHERFGPMGNERYTQYLKDIHSSGNGLIALVDDLLDLSKIETGRLELTFVSVDLNEVVQQCVAAMQQEANRERVIIRTSLPPNLPHIVADARSVRQIALNLLANSIAFTGAGGQVIVSTALTDDHELALRMRDTGSGMSEKEVEAALEPFRQIATSRSGGSGTGLGLSISKALAEANHARFHISSRVGDGTLVEVAFPATRVLAQ